MGDRLTTEELSLCEYFFHTTAELFSVVDKEGRVLKANPAWTAATGFTPAEIEGRASLDLVHPEDRPRAQEAERKVLQDAAASSHESRCLCKDGTSKWILWRLIPCPQKDIYIASGSDITARKLTEQALLESETTLRKILDQAPMAMAIVELDGTIVYINQQAVKTFGYPHSEIPNMDRWWQLAYPDPKYRQEVVARWMGKVHKAFAEKTAIEGGEYRATCKDGSVKICFIFGVIAANKVFVMFDDITERANAERALRESESRYRGLVEATRTGYVIINKEGRVMDANTEYVRLTGRKDLKEVIGRTVLEWTAPHEKERNAEAVARCARDGYICNFEVEYAAPSGKFTPVEINANVVTRAGVPQILTLCRDISARRHTEAQVLNLNQNLEQRVKERTAELTRANEELTAQISQRLKAEQAKDKLQEQLLQSQKLEAVGRLAGGIAHDFNNILVSISGYAEILSDTMPEGAPAKADLAEILLETERGAALTRQLLTFSARQEPKPEVVSLNAIAAGSEKMLKRLIGSNMHLETRLDEGLLPVRADPTQIAQVIVNLVINARDAMPDGGRITLATRNADLGTEAAGCRLAPPPGAYGELTVTDSGTGMTPETMEHLFEPFFTTKKPGQGTGLGLSTVYGIVNRAGGGICVESSPGRGTTFKIYLPRAV
ncbi:MAG: PAS domain S-box protein [Elusimicrobiales bacterium]|nr:PAS domain S-box protein [Elusimicrobiales bacterium]